MLWRRRCIVVTTGQPVVRLAREKGKRRGKRIAHQEQDLQLVTHQEVLLFLDSRAVPADPQSFPLSLSVCVYACLLMCLLWPWVRDERGMGCMWRNK